MPSDVRDIDRGWKALLERVRDLSSGAYAKVGILGDPGEVRMHIVGRPPLTLPELASVHEFGTVDKTIPERSFIRRTFDEQRPAMQDLARKMVLGILDGRMTTERALGLMGAKLAAEIKKRVTTGPEIPPPNAPAVAAAKEAKGKWNEGGRAQAAGQGVRTLVDTGRMIGAVTWAVIMDGRGGERAVAK